VNLVLAETANSAPLPEPARFFSLSFFVIFSFLFAYFIGTPSFIYKCAKFNREFGRKMTVGLELSELTDEELLADARKRSPYIRSILPIGVVCIIAFTQLIGPFNWIFVVIFGPLLAFSYYKAIDSIMDLQTPDDETSDEKTD
jgi:hypothetical protein